MVTALVTLLHFSKIAASKLRCVTCCHTGHPSFCTSFACSHDATSMHRHHLWYWHIHGLSVTLESWEWPSWRDTRFGHIVESLPSSRIASFASGLSSSLGSDWRLRCGSNSGPINLKAWRGWFEMPNVTGGGGFFKLVSESDSSRSCCWPLKRSLVNGDRGSSYSNRFSEDGESSSANSGVEGFSFNATTWSSSDKSMTGLSPTTCFQYQLFHFLVDGESAVCIGDGGPFSRMWSM